MPTMLRIPSSITLRWDGPDALPTPAGLLQPGDTTMPLAKFHAFGSDPVLNNLIATGKLTPVHVRHEFQDGDDHCISCSITREGAEKERAAKLPPKAKAAPTP